MEVDLTLITSTWDLLKEVHKESRFFYFLNVASDLFTTVKVLRNDVVGNT